MNPFANNPQDSVSALGEIRLIERLRAALGDASPRAPEGIGDDCAVFHATPGAAQLATADPVIYGQHFDDSVSPERAIAKLLKRNLSDIAAMGGIPRRAIVSLALPPNLALEWIDRAYSELGSLARRYGVAIAGGDVSGAEGFLGVFLTLLGEMPAGRAPLLRHQAQPGSALYVTGSLGGSRLRKHYDFEPRLLEGQWLAEQPEVVACSDISDGLGKDAANALAPGCAAEIDADAIPIAEDAREQARRSGKSALYHAFNDGEDFELLFALAPGSDERAFEARWHAALETPLARIGAAAAQASADAPRLIVRGAPGALRATGYEHLGQA